MHAKVTKVYLSGGDHADTDDDEDEETGGMFDPQPPHSRCSHSHSSWKRTFANIRLSTIMEKAPAG